MRPRQPLKSPTGGKSVRRAPTAVAVKGKVSGPELQRIQPQLATAARQGSAEAESFQAFLDADDLPQMQSAFSRVLGLCGLQQDEEGLYDKLKEVLTPKLNFKQKNLFQVVDKRRKALLSKNSSCAALEVVCVGAGPVGLRTAVEMALLGAQVTVLERRERFTRLNILHLWDWVCNDLLSLGANGADLLGKSFFHIGTRDLQVLLARIALVLGMNIFTGLEASSLDPPTAESDGLWLVTARVASSGELKSFPANTVFAAGGCNDAFTQSMGFQSVVLGTSSAVGLVAHLENKASEAERNLEEFSLARQYFQELFQRMASKGMDLENVVYYQGNTHYFVMTPKRDSLLSYGVLRKNLTPPDDLQRENVDPDRLKAFARAVAEEFKLPSYCEFVKEGAAVQLFDFSTRKASKTSCQVREDGAGHQVAVMLVGDAVLEPFWPEGLGINRGFHTAYDAIWVLQRFFASGHTAAPESMRQAREDLFAIIKSLSAFTKSNIVVENYKGYALDPATRYKSWKGVR